MMKQSGRLLFCALLLAAVWCLLSGYYGALLLSLGALSCSLAVLLYARVAHQVSLEPLRLKPLASVRYLGWLLVEIAKSNIEVLRAIVRPQRIAPAFFEVEADRLDENSRVVYANSITLTPGTVSVDVSERTIGVHALTRASREGLSGNAMLREVGKLSTRHPEGEQDA